MSKKRDFDGLQKRRMRAASLLRRGRTQAEVAEKLGVSRQSVSRWAGTIEAEVDISLRKAGRAGRLPRIDAEQRTKLAETLKAPGEYLGTRIGMLREAGVASWIQSYMHTLRWLGNESAHETNRQG